MDIPFLPPVFFKASDVPSFKTLKEFEVCKAVFEVVPKDNLTGCQRIRGLWRIYVKSQEDRIKLLSNRITLRNQSIGVYKDNPYRAGLDSPDQETVKLTFRDIPLSKGNNGIDTFLTENSIEKTSSIQYGKIRDTETKELTEILSGDRIVYVKPFTKQLARNVYVSGTTASVYYTGQILPDKPKLCTNCFSGEHFKSQCDKPKLCIKCKKPEHGDDRSECEALRKKPATDVTPFQGKDDILSNFYPCTIHFQGIIGKSSEHCYQYVKAIRRGKPEIATRIKDAPNAFLAKKFARDLPYSHTWADEKLELMETVLDAKAKQVPEFREELRQSQSNRLVEAVTGDYFWSSGLNKEETLNTKVKFWPGENQMGSLLTKVRENIKQNTNEYSEDDDEN